VFILVQQGLLGVYLGVAFAGALAAAPRHRRWGDRGSGIGLRSPASGWKGCMTTAPGNR
jgi:hypothetical protein